MVEKQTDLAMVAIPRIDAGQEIMQLQKRHIRVDELDVSLQQLSLKPQLGEGEGPLALKVAHLIRPNLCREWVDECR